MFGQFINLYIFEFIFVQWNHDVRYADESIASRRTLSWHAREMTAKLSGFVLQFSIVRETAACIFDTFEPLISKIVVEFFLPIETILRFQKKIATQP